MRELPLIQYSILKALPHCFTTRAGGVSEGAQKSLNLSFTRESSQNNVLENYRRAAKALGVEFEKMTRVPQVHGDGVFTVTERDAGMGIAKPLPAAVLEHGYDAMITNVPQITLCTLHADCVPVLLCDPEPVSYTHLTLPTT